MEKKNNVYNYVYSGQRTPPHEKKPEPVPAGAADERLSIGGFFPKFGFFSVNIARSVLKGLIKAVKFILSDLLSLAAAALGGLKWLFMELIAPFRERFNLNKGLTKKVRKAKKEGEEAYKKALAEFWYTYLFGEDGVFYTAFNYILPVLSIAFLVGIIRYGSGLEYGLSVEYNGREIGMITAEADLKRLSGRHSRGYITATTISP